MRYPRYPYHQIVRARDLGATDAAPISKDTITTGTAALLVYHGYKRTGSLVWALIYGIAGKKVPVVAVPVALAQGLGKKKTCTVE